MCRVGDQVIEKSRGRESFLMSDERLIVFVVEQLLKRVPDTAERLAVLLEACDHAGVSTVVAIAHAQGGRLGEGEHAIPDSSIDCLKEYALNRIRHAAKTHLLWEAPLLVRILYAWKALGEEIQMREWVTQNTLEDADLVRFLGRLVGGHAPSRRFDVSAESLEGLFGPRALADRIDRAIRRLDLSERDSAVLQVVRDALREGGDRAGGDCAE
jgi:hypothetical protein